MQQHVEFFRKVIRTYNEFYPERNADSYRYGTISPVGFPSGKKDQ